MYLVLVIALGMIFAAAAQIIDFENPYRIQNAKALTCLYGRVESSAIVSDCDGAAGFSFQQREISPNLEYGDNWFQLAFSILGLNIYCLQAGLGNGAATNNAPAYMKLCNANEQAQVWQFHSLSTDWNGDTIYQYSDKSSELCLTKTPDDNTVVMYDCAARSSDALHQFWYKMKKYGT